MPALLDSPRDTAAAAEWHVLALTLEYDGTGFSGWQRQPGRRTVEGVLRQAVAAVTGEEPRLTAAGRTDAGAHAHGQVVGCGLRRRWEPERLRQAVNAHLPDDVVVVDAEPAPAGFHARFDALARTYRYVVETRPVRRTVARQYAWCVRGPLDLEAMREAAALLRGTHDFASFGRSPRADGSTVRTVGSVEVRRVDAPDAAPGAAERCVAVIEVSADAFLYGMMRSIAGALVDVGMGRTTVADVAALLERPRPRGARPVVAPAHGLHQWRVTYPSPAPPGGSDREGR